MAEENSATEDSVYDAKSLLKGEDYVVNLISKVIGVLLTLLVTISLTLSAWCLTMVVDVNTRLAVVEGNRYTIEDAKKDQGRIEQRMDQMIMNVNTTLSEIKIELAKLPQDVPPDWFEEKVDRMDARLQRIETEVMSISKNGTQ